MSAGSSSMSFWIKFFSDAGIPAGVAANYAVIFTEQRIQEDMLLDLNKEYLSDMGISVLGDVIGILRHAKDFHTKSVREKALKASVTNSPPTNRSTPASRTVNHYLRKDTDMPLAPMNEPVIKTGPKISMELANRLGTSTPPAETSASTLSAKKISLKSQKEEVPVPKVRRVLPEHEGRYKVSMPKGTTEKTKKIMASKTAGVKSPSSSSVFARLGQGDSDSASNSPVAKVTVTGLDNVMLRATASSTTSAAQSSVFKRLGGISESAIKRPASSTCPDSDDSEEDDGFALEYAGILKTSATEKTEAMLLKKKAIITQRKKLMAQKKKLIRVAAQKPEVTTSSEGILAQDLIMDKKSARSRLGKPVEDGSTGAAQTMDFTISKDVGTRVGMQKTSGVAVSRLGGQKTSGVAASRLGGQKTSGIAASRLGGQKTSAAASSRLGIQKVSGVSGSRLGASVTVSSSEEASPSTKLQRRRKLSALKHSKSISSTADTPSKGGVFARLGKPASS